MKKRKGEMPKKMIGKETNKIRKAGCKRSKRNQINKHIEKERRRQDRRQGTKMHWKKQERKEKRETTER